MGAEGYTTPSGARWGERVRVRVVESRRVVARTSRPRRLAQPAPASAPSRNERRHPQRVSNTLPYVHRPVLFVSEPLLSRYVSMCRDVPRVLLPHLRSA